MKQIVMALCVLFVMCAFGNDSSIAEKVKAAQDGNAQAQFELGKCYANGEGPQTQWHPDRLKVYGANNVTNSREGGERHINFGNMKLKNDVLGRIRPASKERDSKSSWKWITGYAVLIAILLARIFNLNLSFGNIADQSVTSKEGCCAIAAIIISFFVFSYCTAGDGHLNWGIVFGIPVCLLSIVIIRWQLFVKLRQKAIAGNTGAILEVARRYAKGNGVKRNEVEAMMWYGKVARQGNPEAANWFRNLAERGSAQAQYNLGVCYENGEGVEKDMTEAVRWFRLAAENGYGVAQLYLGLIYEKGDGVTQDSNEAVKWLRKAADQDIEGAKTFLKELEGKGVSNQ